jgi:hypothetical protein
MVSLKEQCFFPHCDPLYSAYKYTIFSQSFLVQKQCKLPSTRVSAKREEILTKGRLAHGISTPVLIPSGEFRFNGHTVLYLITYSLRQSSKNPDLS